MEQTNQINIEGYWRDTLRQDAKAMRAYFHDNAWIKWHNTNELFNVEEFIRANCEYPGSWDGEIERAEQAGNLLITAARVWSADWMLSFHVTSFIQIRDGKITALDEYWGDDGTAPQWRQEMKIGRPIDAAEEEKNT